MENAAVRRRLQIRRAILGAVFGMLPLGWAAGAVQAAPVVALGASQTYGKGVARGEDFPAQLQAMLRARGVNVTVRNAGINGNTTAQMAARLDGVISADTRVVILQPGGNDNRVGAGADTEANVAAMTARIQARHINVVMVPNQMFRGLPRQADGQHLTPAGYQALAAALVPQVASALGR